jgi:hypothetical protein
MVMRFCCLHHCLTICLHSMEGTKIKKDLISLTELKTADTNHVSANFLFPS